MDAATIVGCFRNRSILVTGSTGFVGKMLVEKILRIQPEVRKLYLLLRATDAAAAKQRVLKEVVGTGVFDVLREGHGAGFLSFIEEKICPLNGDIMHDNFGLGSSEIVHLSQEVDAIINVAATTNFYERYDVALATNTTGVSRICQFAQQCTNLKMLLHVSTAYVAGEQVGLLLEKPFRFCEALREGCHLDIEAEVQLAHTVRSKLRMRTSSGDSGTTSSQAESSEKATMRDLGLQRANHFGWPNTYAFTKAMGEMLLGHLGRDLPFVIIRPSIITSTFKDPMPGWTEGTRTMDTLIFGYNNQNIPCFVADDNVLIDVVPGDIVINAMMVAMASHWDGRAHAIYHVSSSIQNPLHFSVFLESIYSYFHMYPRASADGTVIENKRIAMFKKLAYFHAYILMRYKLPLQLLHAIDLLFGGRFDQYYKKANRSYKLLLLLGKLYAPYTLFKGCFDNSNLMKLSMAMAPTSQNDASMFPLDTSCINWCSYFVNIHIPAALKYATTHRKKAGRA